MSDNHNFWKQVKNSKPKIHLKDAYKLVIERSKADVATAISKVLPSLKPGTSKAGAIRLQPVTKGVELSDEQFELALKEIGFSYVKTIPPKTPESKSSKYNTHVIRDDAGVIHFVVLGGGSASNKGMDYERRLFGEIAQALQTNQPHSFVESFRSLTKCPPIIDVITGFGKRVQRQLTGEPKNVGPVISDITLVDEAGTKHYISLKEKNGVTIANNGIGNAFSEQNGEVKFNGDARINPLFEALHIDTDLACKGLEAFIKKQTFNKQDIVSTNYNKDVVMKYLSSAIDYGYYYVRNLGNGQFEMEDLTTLDNLINFIGNIKGITIKYPYYVGEGMQQKRKHISIEIITDEHIFNFDVRNASGGTLPKQINLVKKS